MDRFPDGRNIGCTWHPKIDFDMHKHSLPPRTALRLRRHCWYNLEQQCMVSDGTMGISRTPRRRCCMCSH